MKLIKKHEIQKYSGLDLLPTGNASDKITEGCIVLEGGGWKAVYSLGVTDYLMLHDINMSAAAGISAGGLAGVGYISGQIGWSARIDLSYRHDPNYIGTGAMLKDHGVTGFTYLYRDILGGSPLDKKRLNDPSRRLAVGATNMLTGETEYFEKGKCNLSGAVRASATVPFVSRPVVMHGVPYLDRDKEFPYKITRDDLCCQLFLEHGFNWGGDWENSKDYQHFEMPSSVVKSLYPDRSSQIDQVFDRYSK